MSSQFLQSMSIAMPQAETQKALSALERLRDADNEQSAGIAQVNRGS